MLVKRTKQYERKQKGLRETRAKKEDDPKTIECLNWGTRIERKKSDIYHEVAIRELQRRPTHYSFSFCFVFVLPWDTQTTYDLRAVTFYQ